MADARPEPEKDKETVVIPEGPAPLKGTWVTLAEKAVPVGRGVTIRVTAQGHKHRDDGGAVGIYELTIRRGAKTEDLRITTEGAFEGEIDAHGILVVITEADEGLRALVVGKTPAPLDEDAATTLLEEAAASHGLPLGGSSYSIEHGVLRYVSTTPDGQEERWRARLGLYTRRIWWLAPEA